ncbi:MAG: triose-phosphate isomerase [Patescibacteria group bacterium]
MNKKTIVANWKTAPNSLAEAEELVNAMDETLATLPEQNILHIILCPPFVFIEEVAKMLGSGHLAQSAFLGAQDIAPQDTGALTGEVSGSMLSKLGVRYVIVGHSDRRKLGENDDVVNKKLKTALACKLTPIVCVGEREYDERFTGFLEHQVRATFSGLSANDIDACLIAYEPVWAISTTPGARPDTPSSALQSVKIIRDILRNELHATRPRFLYGGSVTEHNAGKFLGVPEFGGVLVGGASVHKEEFVKILIDAVHIAR